MGGNNTRAHKVENNDEWHIFHQLKRACDLDGWYLIEFPNNETIKITGESAKLAIELIMEYKPRQRAVVCEHISLKRNFMYIFEPLNLKENNYVKNS